MADRYWVGGTATWDNTPGTKWAATSGGAGGESVPTVEDNVFFNEASSGTVTVATTGGGAGPKYARNLNFSGFTGTFTGNGGARVIISGDFSLDTGVTWSYTRDLVFAGSGVVTTAGKSLSTFIYVSGSSANVTFGDAYNGGGSSAWLRIIDGGSLDTAGYTTAFHRISGISGSLSLGASTLSLASNGFNNPALSLVSGFNFNAGTSQINFSNSNDEVRVNCSGGFNFYDVVFTGANGNQEHLIDGPNSFHNLSLLASGTSNFLSLYLDSNITVSGTLTCSGVSPTARTFLLYGTSGTKTQYLNPGQGIVVTASSLVAANCDFRDITLAGAASGSAPSGAGDCGGNTGIVFPVAKTVYSVGSATDIAGTGWATTSGGPGSTDNFPLAQDTAIINDDMSAANYSLANRRYNFGTIDATNRTTSITLNINTSVSYYGSFKTSSSVTLYSTQTVNFAGRSTTDFNVTGNTLTFPVQIAMPGGTFNLASDYISSRNLTVFDGTFSTQNYIISGSGAINFGAGDNKYSGASSTLNLGSSTIYTNNFYISGAFGSGVTVNPGTSQLYITGTFSNLRTQDNAITLNDVFFTSSGTGHSRFIFGNNSLTVNSLSGTALGSGYTRYVIGFTSGLTVNNTLTITGLSATQRGYMQMTGGVFTVSSAVLTNVDFEDVILQGNASGVSPSGAGDCGNNSGIVFPAPKTVYRVGTETTWGGNNSWATSSSGVGSDDNFPLPQDIAVIDDGTELSGTLVFSSPNYNHPTLDCTGRTLPLELAHNSTIYRYGSYLLSSGITISGNSQQAFYGTGTMSVICAGNQLTYTAMSRSYSSPGTLQAQDAFLCKSALQIQRGTFDANNYNITILQFSTNSSNGVARSIIMGSGLWTLTGTSSVWSTSNTSGFVVDKGTADILLFTTGNSTSKMFRNNNGPVISLNKLIIGDATATGTKVTLQGALSFTAIESTKTVSHGIYISKDTQYTDDITIGTWSVSGTSGNPVDVRGITGFYSPSFTGYPSGERSNFKLTNATSGIDYLVVRDIGELNGFKFAVGENSTDSGNNFNVYFTDIPPPPASRGGNMFLLFP